MAACLSKNEHLNETLTSLRSTSKGQLQYNGEISSQLSCSFESFLSEFNQSNESINVSMTAFLSLEENDDDTSSENETKASSETVLNNSVEKTNNIVWIPKNFNTENELDIRDYHDECRGNAEQRKKERTRIIERRMENLNRDTKQMLRDNQEYLAEEKRQFESEIAEREYQVAEELGRRKAELDEQAIKHKQRLDEIYTSNLIEESHLAREEEEMRAALENLKKNIITLHHQVLKNIEIIQEKFSNSKDRSFIEAQEYEDIELVLSGITKKAEAVVVRCQGLKSLSNAEDYLECMNKLIQATFSLDNRVTNILKTAQEKAIATLKKKKEMEEADKIRIEEMKQEQQKKLEMNKKPAEKAFQPNKKSPTVVCQVTTKEKAKEHKFVQFISDNALADYAKLQEHLNNVHASYKEFTSDPKHTKYKFDLQKAVNIPINALSAHSPSHLNDKIYRLVTLLSGENVEVRGRQVNCQGHPSAMIFCKDQVAKKLVMQGAQQVSSNPSSAFLYAPVIVGIWSAFPDVGELILAHFHKSYPYLVPYYMPQVVGQSNNDYHKALGYSVSNDKIEDEDHFLKKFSGTVQLYAAVVSSKGATTPDHPHGIDKGWTWLARTLNLKPHPSITATMLYQFIKVAGHLLMERYRKQFQKLLLMLCKDFIPAIEKVTPAEKQGPLKRFQDFLDECIKTQRISIPEGYLTERWWQTGHL